MKLFRKTQRIHFVEIGKSGMSGIAELLINLGYNISGSDIAITDTTKRLSRLGAKIVIGQRPNNINNVELVVVASVLHQENVEVMEAKENNIPVIPKAEILKKLMQEAKPDNGNGKSKY